MNILEKKGVHIFIGVFMGRNELGAQCSMNLGRLSLGNHIGGMTLVG